LSILCASVRFLLVRPFANVHLRRFQSIALVVSLVVGQQTTSTGAV
jgi:hypothetical protein